MLSSFRALPFDSQNPLFFLSLFFIRKNLQASAFIILPLKWASRPFLELRIWTLTLLAFLLQWCQSFCSTDASGWTEGSLYWGNAKEKKSTLLNFKLSQYGLSCTQLVCSFGCNLCLLGLHGTMGERFLSLMLRPSVAPPLFDPDSWLFLLTYILCFVLWIRCTLPHLSVMSFYLDAINFYRT